MLALTLNEVANVRIHDTTKEQPMKRLIEERQVLKALPFQPIKDIAVKASDAIMPLNFETQPLHHDLSIYNELCQVEAL
ncbi:MAG: hypothetical protein BMS9Abin31_1191 [Gammaproteobacteria bacterium]|nr:MAG: hypothetical protein BMS9Abin31_1191 [Gammaproteobacteria bacterium]